VSEREAFSAEEWRTLQFAPFWIFSAVTGAYDRFDPRDEQAFVRCLEAAALAEGRLGRAVLASVLADREGLSRQFRGERRSIGVGLFQADAVMRKAGDEEAELFKGTLVLGIGEGVARARGRYGTEMSDEDAKSVVLAAQLLGYRRYPAGDAPA
jgi:hypothetical protein